MFHKEDEMILKTKIKAESFAKAVVDFKEEQVGDEASATSGAPASARQGELDAEALFHEYHPRVYAYVRYRIADVAEAEDLCCEILERAWTHLASYDAQKGAFSTWHTLSGSSTVQGQRLSGSGSQGTSTSTSVSCLIASNQPIFVSKL